MEVAGDQVTPRKVFPVVFSRVFLESLMSLSHEAMQAVIGCGLAKEEALAMPSKTTPARASARMADAGSATQAGNEDAQDSLGGAAISGCRCGSNLKS